jgi:bacillolysin
MGKNRLRLGFNALCMLVFMAALVGFQPVQAASNSGISSPSARSADPNQPPPPPDGFRVGYNSQTGKLSFIGGDAAHPLAASGGIGASALENSGKGVLAQYAAAFGLKDPASELQVERTQEEPQGSTVRYQQQYNGIPVLGGELMLNSDAAGNLISLNGKISPDLALSTTQPAISAEQAVKVALDNIQSWYRSEQVSVTATEPSLWVYDERVFMPSRLPPVLVWRMELNATGASVPVSELVLVNAITGQLALHFNQIDTVWSQEPNPPTPDAPPAAPAAEPDALPNPNPSAGGAANVITYTFNHQILSDDPRLPPFLPGTLLCQSPDTTCTTDPDPNYALDADYAHRFALGTYQLYWDQYGRNSIDNAGMTIVSSVHYSNGYQNAFWSRPDQQMVYGDRFSKGDDVVAHELTHGVTNYESNLFYYYQSGAINESLSDLWGEFYDQTNLEGNDLPAVNWLIGEDLYVGAFRSMSNPPAYHDPDKMTSPYYYKLSSDGGGVHHNSGINNKAVFLMVDGGKFNGKTILPLGGTAPINRHASWDKTAAIYYYAQTHLLTSGSDYGDLYTALHQACYVLAETASKGISSADCTQVHNALDAVQMNLSPTAAFNPDAPLCPAGTTQNPHLLFSDDLENGVKNWSFWIREGTLRWGLGTGFASSGVISLFGNDYDKGSKSDEQVSDSYVKMSVSIPAGMAAYLHFKHAFGFEIGSLSGAYYDGGVVEYSVDDVNWMDARPLFSAGQNYNGNILNSNTPESNPLRRRNAFVGASHGYVSTRYNLTSLAGKTVYLRWRLGTDSSGSYLGWMVDDVSVYGCVGNPGVPALAVPANGGLTTTYLPKLDWGNSAFADHYQLQVAMDAAFPAPLLVDVQNLLASDYTFGTPLPDNSKYYWRVRTVNAAGVISAWSAVRYFRTPLVTPGQIEPANDAVAVLKNLRPTFSWSASPGAVSYTLTVATAATMAGLVHKATVTTLSYTPLVDLPAGKTLYWKVQANGANPSPLSAYSQFNTPKPPSVPLLLTPAVNALLTNYLPSFTWKAAIVPVGAPAFSTYNLQVAENQDYKSTAYNGAVGLTSYPLTDPLQANTKYYWRVQACNEHDECSAWKESYLRTPLVTPVLSAPANKPDPLVLLKTLRPDFSWSASPGAVSYTLTVATAANMAGLVHKATVTTTSYTPPVDLPAGKTLYWKVQANGANPSPLSAYFQFNTPKPPSVPVLLTPAVNALLTNYLPSFSWKASTIPPLAPGLSSYRLQVDDDPDYKSTAYDGSSGANYSTLMTPLQANTKYYWRVQACNVHDECSAWSASRSFRTPLVTPGQIEPANDAVTVLKTLRPDFSWSASPGAVSYTLTVATAANMAGLVHKATISSLYTSYTPPVDLPAGKTLYWKVQANGANPSPLSAYSQFNTPKPPSVPVLLTPAVNALVSGYLPSLTWKASTVPPLAPALSANPYHLQVADNQNFTLPVVFDGNVGSASHTFTDPLTSNTKYYWRVQTCNANSECSAWSAVRYFRTAVAP